MSKITGWDDLTWDQREKVRGNLPRGSEVLSVSSKRVKGKVHAVMTIKYKSNGGEYMTKISAHCQGGRLL